MKKFTLCCVAAAMMMFVFLGNARADHGGYRGGYGGGYGGYRGSYHAGHVNVPSHYHHGHHHHYPSYGAGYFGGVYPVYRPYYGNGCSVPGRSGVSIYFGW